MKTISETQNKNLNMEVKGDFYQYPDGTDFVVQNGKMAPTTESSSGGSLFIITGVIEGTGSGTVNKTNTEISEAFMAGKTIVFYVVIGNYEIYSTMVSANRVNDNWTFLFNNPEGNSTLIGISNDRFQVME